MSWCTSGVWLQVLPFIYNMHLGSILRFQRFSCSWLFWTLLTLHVFGIATHWYGSDIFWNRFVHTVMQLQTYFKCVSSWGSSDIRAFSRVHICIPRKNEQNACPIFKRNTIILYMSETNIILLIVTVQVHIGQTFNTQGFTSHTLQINIWMLHHNEEVWGKDHMEFKPDRFTKDNIVKMDPYQFVPFSGGPR